jgi:hypothetical protein
MKRSHALLTIAAGLLCVLTFATDLLAQAWLPPKGEGSVAFSYGNTFIRDHLGLDGTPRDSGHMRTNALTMSVGYGVTDRLALSVDLPYVVSKYWGANPHRKVAGGADPPPNWHFIDDGDYHGTFADYRIDLRFQVLRGQAVLTPFAAAIIPSHSYTYFAHSAAGRHVREYLLGASFGEVLDPLVPNTYVQARYSYAFAERILGVHHDRSNVDLALGYFLTPSLDVRAIGSLGYSHGGIELFGSDTPEGQALRRSIYWPHHDQIGRERYVNVAGGVGYTLTGTVDVYASYVTTVWGENGHKIKNGINVGFALGFSPAQVVRRLFPPGGAPPATEAP